jgi:hypothetical protein
LPQCQKLAEELVIQFSGHFETTVFLKAHGAWRADLLRFPSTGPW